MQLNLSKDGYSEYENLFDFYVTLKWSISRVAKELGCSASTIKRRLVKHGLPIRDEGNEGRRIAISHDELMELYVNQKLSSNKIAEKYGCTGGTVRKQLKQYGIAIRNCKEAQLLNPANKTKKIAIDEDELKDLYVNQKVGAHRLSKKYGCNKGVIYDRLKEQGINTRENLESLQINVENRAIYNDPLFFKQYLEYFKLQNNRKPQVKDLQPLFKMNITSIYSKIKEYKCEDLVDYESNISHFQLKVEDWLKQHNIEYTREFPLGTKRYDIAIKNQKTLIEANPGDTHAIIPGAKINSVQGDKKYHYKKTMLANHHGYRLIHIYDWTINQLNETLAFLLPHKKYHGRETQYLHEVPVKDFIIKHHRQHTCSKNNGSLLINKKTKEPLMALIMKKHTTPSGQTETHLEKLCTKPGTLVRGGFTKLLKNWIKTEGFKGTITTFCDIDINTMNGYKTVGFKEVDHGRNYYYVNRNGGYVWRRQVQKQFIQKLFPEATGNTEKELMESVGYYPIYTAGITKLQMEV